MTLKKIFAGCTLLAGFAVAGLAGSGTAWATDPTTANLSITANVEAECAITAETTGDVGNYDATQTSDTTTTSGTITYQCSAGTTTASIALDGGINGTITQRKMANGTNMLNYNIYQDSNYSTIWGNGTTDTAESEPTSDGTPQTVTFYVDVPSGQYVAAGTYSDTVTANITF